VGGTQSASCQNGRIPFTVQPRLTVVNPHWLSLSYQRIRSWETVRKLACLSKK